MMTMRMKTMNMTTIIQHPTERPQGQMILIVIIYNFITITTYPRKRPEPVVMALTIWMRPYALA